MHFNKLKAKIEKENELNRQRAATLKAKLTQDGVAIYKRYQLRKVIIFGSLTDRHFSGRSDVDIYVEPLDNQKYWEFRHALEDLLDADIDLHSDKDDLNFIKKIIDRGEIIYEA
jgi:predicted nucleotidyltransferase